MATIEPSENDFISHRSHSQFNLRYFLESEGYTNLRQIEGRGWCGLRQFLFTSGLCYGLDTKGYKGRYCFAKPSEAFKSLASWDGKGDPEGDWIKHKGISGEYSNPNNED